MQRSTGIAPSLAPALIVQNVFNGPAQVLLDPRIARLIGGQLPGLSDDPDDCLDAEFSELYPG
jgi:hypothetical protein